MEKWFTVKVLLSFKKKMNKTVLLLVGVVFVWSATAVFAKSENAVGGVGSAGVAVSPTGVGMGTVNQNRVQTQNEGEEQQLTVQTEEQQETKEGTKSAAPRSEVALEHMSEVAKGVEAILTTKTLKGGIGDQVRQIAQDQKQSQDQVKLQIDKVASRSGLVKSLIGSDFKALNNIEKQIIQNQVRIQQLTDLQNQLTNKGDITMVQEVINALVQQNTSLQEMVDSENMRGSLFGWLVKLLVK